MSLLDKMEHIAELEGLEDLVDDDEDEMENSVVEDAKISGDGGASRASRLDGIISEDEDDMDDDDEDDEEVIYTPSDLGYEWQGGPDLGYEGAEEDLGYGDLGYEDQSQLTGSDANENSSLSSAGMLRRVSGIRASTSGHSYSSAPEHTRDDLHIEGGQQRRSTFAGAPGPDAFKRRVSSRRNNFSLGSVAAPPGMNSLNMSKLSEAEEIEPGQGSGSVLQKMKSITAFGSNGRRSTVKNKWPGSTMSTLSTGSDLNSIQAAASKLESGPDSVFAAASVVAQSAATAAKRGHVQFNTDDPVLCMLTLLNVTNPGDDNESFTVSPVNIHGYPPGEGKTEAERQGPYVFVLATVKKVHFDEDERYYTVVRADNGTEQRADTGEVGIVLC